MLPLEQWLRFFLQKPLSLSLSLSLLALLLLLSPISYLPSIFASTLSLSLCFASVIPSSTGTNKRYKSKFFSLVMVMSRRTLLEKLDNQLPPLVESPPAVPVVVVVEQQSHSSTNRSIETLVVVLAVIVILGVVAGIIARLCRSCIDTDVPPAPPPEAPKPPATHSFQPEEPHAISPTLLVNCFDAPFSWLKLNQGIIAPAIMASLDPSCINSQRLQLAWEQNRTECLICGFICHNNASVHNARLPTITEDRMPTSPCLDTLLTGSCMCCRTENARKRHYSLTHIVEIHHTTSLPLTRGG